MRCRKARSFLSAYSNDELSARKAQSVSEHIAVCADCRHEEAFYRSLRESGRSFAGLKVSSDFNSKLLNRVAQERFAETRAKAYLPRKAPAAVWGRILPVSVAACLVLIVGTVSFQTFSPGQSDPIAVHQSGVDDSYLTVQPVGNPNMAANLNKNWSLASQLARADRVSQISDAMAPVESFIYSGGIRPVSAVGSSGAKVPFADNFLHIRPVVRVYIIPNQSNIREAEKTY